MSGGPPLVGLSVGLTSQPPAPEAGQRLVSVPGEAVEATCGLGCGSRDLSEIKDLRSPSIGQPLVNHLAGRSSDDAWKSHPDLTFQLSDFR